MDFGNWQGVSLESLKSDKYTVLEHRDENGRLVVEGDMEELLKDMHCISLEEANKSFYEQLTKEP